MNAVEAGGNWLLCQLPSGVVQWEDELSYETALRCTPYCPVHVDGSAKTATIL